MSRPTANIVADLRATMTTTLAHTDAGGSSRTPPRGPMTETTIYKAPSVLAREAADRLAELDAIATRLACALESLLDSPDYDTGLQVSDDDVAEANAALNARLAVLP